MRNIDSMNKISVQTNKKRQVIDLTSKVNAFIAHQNFADGLYNVLVLCQPIQFGLSVVMRNSGFQRR
jgi:thiamine phosphate synthase YjbQ (UPF0047 family)